jgi:hypothetical protein
VGTDGNDIGPGEVKERTGIGKNQVSVTLFFFFSLNGGVTLAACESGKVWQRLLRWLLRNLQGFVCGSPPGKQTRAAVVVQRWRVNGCQRRPAGGGAGG